MKIITIIPARGGSKGVPRKNIRPIAGKPLIVHSIKYAKSSRFENEIYVSTDDAEIACISTQAGAQIIPRPAEIAGDSATTESAISHALDYLALKGITPQLIILLQATSPFRPENSLDAIIERFLKERCDSLLTISPTHRFFWRIQGKEAVAEYDFLHRPRRQDMKPEDIRYVENGSVYCFTRDHFLKTGNRLGGKIGHYIFPEEYAAEIDSFSDFLYLESLMQKRIETI
ncbi:MAG TPA: acylneuraminate cytidylyltransferase family protein [Candidatus Marinimicrobia bacterium]|nr:acylneuraminate cytidylyltransferase family protein [Candidatus Neomarinimicrobiota bacterium]